MEYKEVGKFRMNSKVWISHESERKTSGKYNQGKIVGVDSVNNNLYFVGVKHFYDGFNEFKYKVAYIDIFTGKGEAKWFNEDFISKEKPLDASN